MLCSIASDHSGTVYKIISITWDGFSKECYLHKYCPDGESKPEDDKDVPERDLVLPARPRDILRELTPPPDREWSPPASDSGSDQGVPIRVGSYNGGGGPVVYAGDEGNAQSAFSSPRPAYVEECRDLDDEEDYGSRPPLSPAMAERGMFPADEEYYSSGNQSYNGDNEDEYHGRDDGGYGQEDQGFVVLPPPAHHQGFVPLGPQESQGVVSLAPQDGPGFVALGPSQGYNSELDSPGGRSERSERSGKRSNGSHGKKQKRSHGEKSDKERGGGKGKSKSKSESKSRSRRNSTSSKGEKKEEKKESSHRGERPRQTRKPSLFALPKF
jgi:hypothetical protein